MRVSVIIPVYNETKTISELLSKVLNVQLIGIDEKEIIVVDGYSTDGTREFLCEFCPKHNIKLTLETKRLGKGMAVRNGFEEATGDIIIIQDADLESKPEEFPKLLEPILKKQTKVVYGSRFINGRGVTPLGSYIGNQIVTLAFNTLFFRKISDIATVYKVFTRDVIKGLKFDCKGFDFDIELTSKISRKYKILEVPISYSPRNKEEGKKLHWLVGLRALFVVFKYRFKR